MHQSLQSMQQSQVQELINPTLQTGKLRVKGGPGIYLKLGRCQNCSGKLSLFCTALSSAHSCTEKPSIFLKPREVLGGKKAPSSCLSPEHSSAEHKRQHRTEQQQAGGGLQPWPSYLRQARWMTVAALFFLRNSSFLLRSLWIICRRCSTGRRWIFTLCPGGGPWTTSFSGDARASSHSFLHPDLNSSVWSGKSEETPPTSLSWVTLFLGVR